MMMMMTKIRTKKDAIIVTSRTRTKNNQMSVEKYLWRISILVKHETTDYKKACHDYYNTNIQEKKKTLDDNLLMTYNADKKF